MTCLNIDLLSTGQIDIDLLSTGQVDIDLLSTGQTDIDLLSTGQVYSVSCKRAYWWAKKNCSFMADILKRKQQDSDALQLLSRI